MLFVIYSLLSVYVSIVRILIIIDCCTIVRLLYTPMLYKLVRQEIQLVLTWIYSSLSEISTGVFRVHKHGSIDM